MEPTGHAAASHVDPFSYILLELAFIVAVAVLGRWAAGRLKQPSVLGELLIGVIVGNIGYQLGVPVFVAIMHMGDIGSIIGEMWQLGESFPEAARALLAERAFETGEVGDRLLHVLTGPESGRIIAMLWGIWIFSNLGVILLLFMVGLESSVAEMSRVGARATAVALVGVIVPFALGLGLGTWLLPEAGTPAHLFLAATLCATSVGITARVFKDLGKIQTREAKVILGAAVIDDVLGLVILAVVVGIAATGHVDLMAVGRTAGLAALFLGIVLAFGERLVARLAPLFESIERPHAKLLFPLLLAFLLAAIANLIELASIVGAFAAGLILSEDHFRKGSESARTIEEVFQPLEAIFAPIFFVLMGMQVNLATFADPSTLGIAGALTVAAIVGKLVAGFAAERGSDRLSVGIGMIPRGEVGLIFASIGKTVGVVDDSLFSAIVIVVMLTTLVTPLGLRWSLFRDASA